MGGIVHCYTPQSLRSELWWFLDLYSLVPHLALILISAPSAHRKLGYSIGDCPFLSKRPTKKKQTFRRAMLAPRIIVVPATY